MTSRNNERSPETGPLSTFSRRLARRCALPCAVLAATYAALGCGSSVSPNEQAAASRVDDAATPAGAVEAFQHALSEGDGAAACARLTSSERRSPHRGGSTCVEAVEAAVGRWRHDGREPAAPRVRSVDDRGTQAIVRMSDPKYGDYSVLVFDTSGTGTWELPTLDLSRPIGLYPLDSD